MFVEVIRTDLVYDCPGVLLGDGGGEGVEDLVQAQAVRPVQPRPPPARVTLHVTLSRGVTSGHCIVSLLSANHKSSLTCESLSGPVHGAVTYSIMLVTSDDAVALFVSQISPGLAG